MATDPERLFDTPPIKKPQPSDGLRDYDSSQPTEFQGVPVADPDAESPRRQVTEEAVDHMLDSHPKTAAQVTGETSGESSPATTRRLNGLAGAEQVSAAIDKSGAEFRAGRADEAAARQAAENERIQDVISGGEDKAA